MAIKRVFTIKDENYDNSFEMAGQSGVLISDDEHIILLDFCQMAQYLVEDLCTDDKIVAEDIVKVCADWSKTLFNIIFNNLFDNIIYDEELELIRE